jgi:hypothetical protein
MVEDQLYTVHTKLIQIKMAKQKQKMHFGSIERFHTPIRRKLEKSDGKYIKSGEDNLFPQYCIDLYNRSTLNASCINSIVQGIIGDGLTSNYDFALSKANGYGQSWNDIFSMVSLDYYLHGSFALEIIYSRDKSKIAAVHHLDYSFIRAKEKDSRGRVPGYFINDNWGKYWAPNKEYDYLPAFNWDKRHEEESQIFVTKGFTPGQTTYGLPSYVSALRICELDTQIDLFHSSNISNGLTPSLAITTYMNGTETDVKNVEEMLRANYSGASNSGKLLFMDVADKEFAPDITVLDPATTDTYYTTINDLVTQKILTAHRITSPLLLGIQQPGSLGNRSEMIDARLLFDHNVIMPLQQQVLKQLEAILNYNYEGIVLGVETKSLFMDGDIEEEVITSVEVTDEENEDIQKEDINPELT